MLELRPLNVLIGANGAGKSNLVSFFKMMNEMMAGRLQQYIASTGHATSNLYFGPRTTPQLEAELVFEMDGKDVDTYRMRLFHAAGDSVIFAEECLSFRRSGFASSRDEQLGAGHKETLIGSTADGDGPHCGNGASLSASAQRLPRLSLSRHRSHFASPELLLCRSRPVAHAGCRQSRGRSPSAQVGQARHLSRNRGDHPTGRTLLHRIRLLEPTGAGGKDIILNVLASPGEPRPRSGFGPLTSFRGEGRALRGDLPDFPAK